VNTKNLNDRDYSIFLLEQFYCERLEELVEEERFDDSNSIFQEFVVNKQEPEEWVFVEYLNNVF
tara:strand:- start:1174 stop:1365 length:192 start_codon:yes stop_codon:yes gene_type:complete